MTTDRGQRADRLTRVDVLPDHDNGRHRLIRRAQLAVAHRHDATSREHAGIRDNPSAGCHDRCAGRGGQVDAAMTGQPRLRRRVEAPHDRRVVGGDGQHPRVDRRRRPGTSGQLGEDTDHGDEHGDRMREGTASAAGRAERGGRRSGWISQARHELIVEPMRSLRGEPPDDLWTTAPWTAALWASKLRRLRTREVAGDRATPVHWPMAWCQPGQISRVPRTVTLSVPGSPGWVTTRGARRGDQQGCRGQPDDAPRISGRGRR